MKPIKLVICGIGPFAGRMPEIHFTDFEEKGLFLISGDTGAGKTTIFDAISFALYGKASGSHRDSDNFRSEYASADTESFVEFTFLHRGKHYVIRRSPSYVREMKRKGKNNERGTRTENEKVTLWEDDKPPITGLTNVGRTIESLLGINYQQFKQVVMIAQGEFWELLNSKTEDRTKILRNIFMTDGYSRLETVLKGKKDEAETKSFLANQSILQYFYDVCAEEDNPFYGELQQLKNAAKETESAWNTDAFLKQIANVIEEEEKKETLLNERCAEEKNRENSLRVRIAEAGQQNERISEVQRLTEAMKALCEQKEAMDRFALESECHKKATRIVKPHFEKVAEKKKEAEQCKAQLEKLRQNLASAMREQEEQTERLRVCEAREPQLDGDKITLHRLKENMPKYERRDALNEEIRTLSKKEEEYLREEEEHAKREENRKQQVACQEETVRRYQKAAEEAAALQIQVTLLTRLAERCDLLVSEYDREHKKKEQDHQKCQDALLKRQEQYKRADLAFKEAEAILEQNRAGILATRLVEGKPCPVCGAEHHPSPAAICGQPVTEEECKQLQAEAESAKEAKDKALNLATMAKTALEEWEANFTKQSEALSAEIKKNAETMQKQLTDENAPVMRTARAYRDSLRETEEKIEKHVDECDILLKQRQKEKTLAEKAQRELERLQGTERDLLDSQKKKLTERQNETHEKLTADRAELSSMEELTFAGKCEAQNYLNELEKKIAALTAEKETAQKGKAEADKNVAALKSAEETQENQEKQLEAQLATLAEELRQVLIANGFEDEASFAKNVRTEAELAAEDKKTQEYINSCQTTETRLSEARKKAENLQFIDVTDLKEKLKTQEEVSENCRRALEKVRANRIINREKYRCIEQCQKDNLEALSKANTAKTLYRLVKGDTGNGRITLEQYVQATGFDRILRAANRRLQPMTEGRFELFRQRDSVGKRTNNFLDLEVYDNLTGHHRPVGNLSGGESFKASLSLALGLSDVVSAGNGGIQMDALFIDEGFGTLDSKSIDAALAILMGLSQTNKLVGVISHREELIATVPQQIRVKRIAEGSTISVVDVTE